MRNQNKQHCFKISFLHFLFPPFSSTSTTSSFLLFLHLLFVFLPPSPPSSLSSVRSASFNFVLSLMYLYYTLAVLYFLKTFLFQIGARAAQASLNVSMNAMNKEWRMALRSSFSVHSWLVLGVHHCVWLFITFFKKCMFILSFIQQVLFNNTFQLLGLLFYFPFSSTFSVSLCASPFML